ncbi:MAG: tandem-95 repeat protein [Ectothiorhodospiraceae bacterium]|nr:tandem-95 repeat protein [Ectothiorhodospiraceae bacterium]
MPKLTSVIRISTIALLFTSTLLVASPVLAKKLKFIYVYDSQGELLTPLNTAEQCPDPDGGNGAAETCQGVTVPKGGDYSIRLSSADLTNNANYVFVVNEYRFVAAGSKSGVTEDTYVLRKSKRRVDDVTVDVINDSLDVNTLSEAIVQAIEEVHHLPQGRDGTVGEALGDVLDDIDADELNHAMGNSDDDNSDDDDDTKRQREIMRALQESLSDEEKEGLEALAKLAVQHADDPEINEYLRKNVVQAVTNPEYLSETVDRVFSHVAAVQAAGSGDAVLILDADRYVLYPRESASLSTDRSLNPSGFFAYTWVGVESIATSASFTQDYVGNYRVCATGEMSVGDGSSTDCLRLLVKDEVEAIAIASERRVAEGAEVLLSGRYSVGATTFTWSGSAASAVAIEDSTARSTTWTAPAVPGIYNVTLSINGGEDADSLTIEVYGILPVAIAESDKEVVYLGDPDSTFNFSSGSISTDGTSVDSLLWAVVNLPAGATPVISDVNAETFSFSADLPGLYTIQLTANKNGNLHSAELMVQVREHGKPVANAGPDQVAFRGQSVTLDGSFSYGDVGRSITYSWNAAVGNIADAASSVTRYTATAVGNFMVTLGVFDGPQSGTDSLIVEVRNRIPAASDDLINHDMKEVYEGQLPATDLDGDSLIYSMVTEIGSGSVTIDAASGEFIYIPGGSQGCRFSASHKPTDNGAGGLDVPVIKLCADKTRVAPGETITLTTSNSIKASRFSGFEWNVDVTGVDDTTFTFVSTEPATHHICITGNIGSSPNISTACVDVTVDGNLDWGTCGVDYSEPGLIGGHFDVDTSDYIAKVGDGSTRKHTHEYDDKFNVDGIDAFRMKDRHKNLASLIEPDQKFKIISINADLSPGARIAINSDYVGLDSSSYQLATDYDNASLASLPVYSLSGVDGTLKLDNLGVYFDRLAIINNNLHPTNTGDVRKNVPGKLSEWRNGAYVLQVVAVNDAGTDEFATDVSKSNGGVQGVATDGLLWEMTVFWHWKGPSYHQSGWASYDPTDEGQKIHNDIGEQVKDEDCTSPESNFADSFQYRVDDGYDHSNIATIWFNVGWVNSLPMLDDVSITTNEDTSTAGTFTATDLDSQTITYTMGDSPLQGNVVLNPNSGAYTYTPNADVNGTDSFTVFASDGKGLSAPATISITITPVNDVPVAFYAGNLTTDEDTSMSGMLGGLDPDGDVLDFRLVVQAAKGDIVITDAATGAFTFNPYLNENGSDSFYFVINDGTLDGNLKQILINIPAINDEPLAADIGPLDARADKVLNGTLNGSDVDGDTLIYSIVSTPAKGSVALMPETGEFAFTPEGTQLGTDSFTYRVSDGLLSSSVATASINILEANAAPVAAGQVITVVVGTTFGGTLTGTDLESSALSYALVDNGRLGNATISNAANGEFEYLASVAGSDFFTFTANDGEQNSAVANVTVNVISLAEYCAGPQSVPVDLDGDGYADYIELAFGTAANDDTVTPFGMDPVALGVSFLDDDDSDGYDDFVELWLGSDLNSDTSMPSVSRLKNLPACMTGVGDFQPPAMQGFNILTPMVDIDAAPTMAKAKFAITALDNAAGIARVDVLLLSPSGAELTAQLVVASTATGNPKVVYAEFESQVFSRYAEAGTWTVAELTITDAKGHALVLTQADLQTRGFDNALTVLNSLGDAAKPTLSLFDVLTPTVDLTAGDTVAQFQVDATDTPAGIGRIHVRLRSPSGDNFRWAESTFTGNQTSVSVSIDSNIFDPFAEPGVWTVSELVLVDEAGNKRVYETADLTGSGYPVSVTVISNLDTAAPALDFFEVITDVVDPTPGDVQAGYNVTASDTQSGVKVVVVTLSSPAGFIVLANHSTLDNPATLTTRIDAEAFANNAEMGIWTVSQIDVVDAAGNVASYNTADLTAAGFETEVRVLRQGCCGINHPPVATGMSIVTDEDVPVSDMLLATDEDGHDLTFTLVTDGELGSVQITDSATGAFTYTPNADANGIDSFTFKADDGYAESNIATVTVTINPIADAPTGRDLEIVVYRNTLFSGGVFGDDADGDAFTFSIDTDGSLGTATITDATPGDIPDSNKGDFEYQPNIDVIGNDSFTYTVSDGGLTSVPYTVSVVIKPEFGVGSFSVVTTTASNQDANVWLIGEASMSIGNSQIDAAWVTITGPSGQSIALAATGLDLDNNTPITLSAFVDPVAVNLEPGVWTFNNLRALRTGTAASILVADDIGAIGFDDEVIVIGNASPIAADADIATPLGVTYFGTLVGTDANSDALTYRIIGNGSPGVVALLDAGSGAFSYTPQAIGAGSFSFQVNDGQSDATTRGVITVTITDPGDGIPVASDSSYGVDQDVAFIGTLIASDPNGDALIYSVVDAPVNGRLVISDTSTGEFNYHPDASYLGTDSFTFRVSDGVTDSNTATVNLTVVVPNGGPVPSAGAVSVLQNTVYNGNLTATDPNGDTLTYILNVSGGLGSVVVDAATGAFTYTPNLNALGRDFFTFSVNDGVNTSAQVTMWVDIVSLEQVCGTGGIKTGFDSDADGWADVVEQAFGTATNDASDTPAGLDATALGVIFTDDDDADSYVDFQEVWLLSDKDDINSVPELWMAECFNPSSDGIKPRLLGFNIATPNVDLNSGDTVVSFDMTLLDNASGIRRARISLLSPSGVLVTQSMSYDSYPLLTGLRLSTDPLGEFAEAGSWMITGLTLFDEAGNRLDISTTDLSDAGFSTTVAVANSAGDATGPSLDNFAILTPTVYPGTVVDTMQFSITLSDSGAGVSSARINMVGPSGVIVSAVNTLATPEAAVTMVLVTPVLSDHLEQGIWNVLSVLVVDAAGNSVEYVDNLASMGYDTSLQSTNPQSDNTAPAMESFAVLESEVFPATATAKMKFSVSVSDDLAGVERVRIDLRGPSGQLLYAWGGYASVFPLVDTAQVETTVLSNVLEQGTWIVEKVVVFDEAGNRSETTTSELTTQGMDTTVVVSY